MPQQQSPTAHPHPPVINSLPRRPSACHIYLAKHHLVGHPLLLGLTVLRLPTPSTFASQNITWLGLHSFPLQYRRSFFCRQSTALRHRTAAFYRSPARCLRSFFCRRSTASQGDFQDFVCLRSFFCRRSTASQGDFRDLQDFQAFQHCQAFQAIQAL